MRHQPSIEADIAVCVTARESVRLREEALTDLASNELAHRVKIMFQVLKLFLMQARLLLFAFRLPLREDTGDGRHGRQRGRMSVFAVGAVGTLQSFSRVAVCNRLDAREHGRGVAVLGEVLESMLRSGTRDEIAVTSRGRA